MISSDSEITIKLIPSGKQYFNLLCDLIDGARNTIHLQVYIFRNDETGKLIIKKLCNAVARGVKVYLVVDGYASTDFDDKLISNLKAQDIYVKRFSPIHILRLKIGRRLHHKVFVADGNQALIGGINIADRYNRLDGIEPWLDHAVYINGQVVNDVQKFCLSYLPVRIRKRYDTLTKMKNTNESVKLIQNDWWRKKTEISTSYNSVIRKSKKELIIVASYFLPGFVKRRLLIQAAKRGVHITIITASYSDVWIMKPAIKYLYGLLLRNNIQIYEWGKSVLHSKIAIADGNWSTIGSYNLNALSDYGSTEANMEVIDENFYKDCKAIINDTIITGSAPITPHDFFSLKSRFLQPYRWTCYHLVRTLFSILFWMMRWTRESNNQS